MDGVPSHAYVAESYIRFQLRSKNAIIYVAMLAA